MEKIWTTIRYNYSLLISLLMVGCVLFWAYGCQSTVVSIMTPGRSLNRAELQAELDAFIAQAQLRFAELDRQDQVKSELFNAAITYATEGTINPIGVALTLGNILGLGAVIDNRRKDTRIKAAKSEIATLSEALTKAEG